MQRLFISLVLVFGLMHVALGQERVPPANPPGNKPTDHPSYAIGFNIGKELADSHFLPTDFSFPDLVKGIVDSIGQQNCKLDEMEMKTAFEAIRNIMDVRAKKNLEAAVAFLEANKKKQGVITLPSGLQYSVIKSGNGAQPTATSTVKVHYEGTLVNGKVFDSSIKRGEPIEFPVRGVIAGWTEALQRMKVGDKWKLFIPPNLAYKEEGSGSAIGPNEALIFEVELLEVK